MKNLILVFAFLIPLMFNLNAQESRFQFNVAADGFTALSDFDLADYNVGGVGGFLFYVDDRLAVGANAGYLTDRQGDGVRFIPVLAAARYKFAGDIFYLVSEAGLYFLSGGGFENSESRFSFSVGASLKFNIFYGDLLFRQIEDDPNAAVRIGVLF